MCELRTRVCCERGRGEFLAAGAFGVNRIGGREGKEREGSGMDGVNRRAINGSRMRQRNGYEKKEGNT